MSIRANIAHAVTDSMLREAIRNALNDGECVDWFARAHDPREKLLRELADGDGFKVFDLTHSEDASA